MKEEVDEVLLKHYVKISKFWNIKSLYLEIIINTYIHVNITERNAKSVKELTKKQ
jgi:endonuclease III-like uncharacterized protein